MARKRLRTRGCPHTLRLTSPKHVNQLDGIKAVVICRIPCEFLEGHPGPCRRSLPSGDSISTITWDGVGTKECQTEFSLDYLNSRRPGK